MADDVTVTFGASIEKLLAGINGGTDAIKQFASQVEGVTGSVGKVAEAIGSAFAVEKIADFISRMAELGEQTERTAAMLGVSTASAQQLGFAAQLTGSSSDSLALSMERLQVNLQKAQTGAGPAALALQALGMNAKELIGLSVDQQMNKIADAVSHFADGGNKTAIVMELLGRGGAQMIPVLDQGAAGLEHMREAALNAGAIMSGQTVGVLSNMSANLTTMKSAATGLGAKLISELAYPINDVIHGLTDMTSAMNAIITGGKLWEIALEELRYQVVSFLDPLVLVGKIAKDVFTLNWGAISGDWSAGLAQIRARFQEHEDKITAIMAVAREKMKKDEASEGAASGLAQAPATQFLDKGAGAAAMKDLDGDLKVMQQGLAQKRLIYDADAAQFKITQDQKFALLQSAVQQEEAAEMTRLQQELQNGNLSVEQRATVENKIKELHAKTNTELVKLDEQSIAASQKQWLGYINTVTGAFNSQITGLLQGTVTWSQAMKNMLLDLTTKFIEMVEKWAAEWLAGELARTTATTTGAAVRAGAEEAGAAASLGAQIAAATASIEVSVGQTFASLAAWLTTTFGPAGIPMAVAGAAGVSALALSHIPHLDVGGFVLSDGMAMIHKGETVTPAQTAPLGGGAGSSGGSGGGPSTTIVIQALDSADVHGWLNRGGGQKIMQFVSQGMLRNPSMRPAY